jgi:hypothetical protein
MNTQAILSAARAVVHEQLVRDVKRFCMQECEKPSTECLTRALVILYAGSAASREFNFCYRNLAEQLHSVLCQEDFSRLYHMTKPVAEACKNFLFFVSENQDKAEELDEIFNSAILRVSKLYFSNQS